MNFFTHTTLYVTGTINEIITFKSTLPIDNNFFDFRKIIPIPLELKHIFKTSPQKEIEILNGWCRDNWGTSGNGLVERISEIYGHNEMALKIELSVPYNEPLHIINKITEENSNLQFFTYHISFSEDQYIGFKPKGLNRIELMCEISYDDHYEQQGYKINQEILLKLKESDIGYLQIDFLLGLPMGNHILENLQNISR